ncbi:MAG TPA: hypothetical protein PKD92_06560 [Novosphingobium sp.]|nr:hypothetical protein [Novosphingobium sp.]
MPPLTARSRFFDEFRGDFPLGHAVKPLHGDPLPSPVSASRVRARGENGILTLNLPRKTAGGAKTISIT